MKLKPYETKLDRDFMECLQIIIAKLIASDLQEDDDKMLMCLLAEIKHRIYLKLDNGQKETTMSFTPAQAFALRILFTDYVMDNSTSTGNKLHRIANQVHKFYQ